MNFLEKLLYPVQNCEEITLCLCKVLKLTVSKTSLVSALLEHPDYPSMLAIKDAMDSYGVDNISLRITKTDDLQKYPQPFIAQILSSKTRTKLFTVVYHTGEQNVLWYNPESHKQETISLENFKQLFTGYIQIYENNENSGEKEYAINYRKEKIQNIIQLILAIIIPALTLFIGIFSGIKYGFSTTFLPNIYTLFVLVGVIIGAILLLYEVDQYNPTLRKVCTGSAKTNCAAILHSDGSKIFGIQWSVIGFSYFVGILMTLLSSGITNPSILTIAAWLNLLVLPYTVYSVYYQARIVRQWCPMCLGIQVVLICLFIVSLLGGFLNWNISIDPVVIFPFIINIFIAFLATYILLPTLEKAKSNKSNVQALQRLKHNPMVFNALLINQKKALQPFNDLGIKLGNPNGKYHIIKICNPYCGPCAKAHPIMDELLENNPEIQLQIIFSTSAKNENDERTLPVKHLMGIASQGNTSLIKQALDDWYLFRDKTYDDFASKYVLSQEELDAQQKQVKTMQKWVDDSEVKYTPAFFINGYLLPETYSLHDLRYFFSL